MNLMTSDTKEAGAILEERADDYLQLARRIALGETIEADRIADACADHRASADEFQDLVKQLQHRQKLREQAALRGEKLERVRLLESELQAASATLDKAVLAHRATVAQLQPQIADLHRECAHASTLDSQLARTCPNKELVREFQSLEPQIKTGRDRLRDANDGVRRAKNELAAADPGDRSSCEMYLQRAEEVLRAVETEQRELAERRQRLFEQMVEF